MIRETADRIVWLGHDAFRIDAQKTIYIDPYQIKSSLKADIIFVTHDHYDHCSPDDIKKIQGPKTKIVTEKDSAKKLSGQITVLAPGEETTLDGIKIKAVPAYNLNKKFHPKANGWLGFIIELNGVKIYHAGDTDYIPEMEDIHVDIALLPVSGTYVMSPEEAVEAALQIKPKIAIPMHFGSIVGELSDAQAFKEALEGKVEVLVPKQM